MEPPSMSCAVCAAIRTLPAGPPTPIAELPEKMPVGRTPPPEIRRSDAVRSMLPPKPGPEVSAEIWPPERSRTESARTMTSPPRPGPSVLPAMAPPPEISSVPNSARTLPPAPGSVAEALTARMPVKGSAFRLVICAVLRGDVDFPRFACAESRRGDAPAVGDREIVGDHAHVAARPARAGLRAAVGGDGADRVAEAAFHDDLPGVHYYVAAFPRGRGAGRNLAAVDQADGIGVHMHAAARASRVRGQLRGIVGRRVGGDAGEERRITAVDRELPHVDERVAAPAAADRLGGDEAAAANLQRIGRDVHIPAMAARARREAVGENAGLLRRSAVLDVDVLRLHGDVARPAHPAGVAADRAAIDQDQRARTDGDGAAGTGRGGEALPARIHAARQAVGKDAGRLDRAIARRVNLRRPHRDGSGAARAAGGAAHLAPLAQHEPARDHGDLARLAPRRRAERRRAADLRSARQLHHAAADRKVARRFRATGLRAERGAIGESGGPAHLHVEGAGGLPRHLAHRERPRADGHACPHRGSRCAC